MKPSITRQTSALVALGIAGVLFPLSSPLMAQESAMPSLLPGGASSLTETHGDWTIRCQVVTQEEASERICAMSQRQANAQGQQVLAIELLPSPEGLEGAIVLPFGLAVTQPVALTIDEGEPINASFSTCLPAGCVVPIDASSDTLAAMRAGNQLVVSASNVNGQPLELPVSLMGFSAATNRIEALEE
ncbi:invasion associated locus B family protein [Halomonas sp. MCCC 1A11036]|uniref:Invasion associated locus B family protein n=1 Tax=Billgrantia zhangzhouensis TaxID=2733481 RepID=A0ABS9AFC8_9GAMM|nr:invasion associated locus B family protein [Halomonas zhangzhouensis]MCE8020458.1 invasion associated locus B family protein [Halomonas zhangzhouensis]